MSSTSIKEGEWNISVMRAGETFTSLLQTGNLSKAKEWLNNKIPELETSEFGTAYIECLRTWIKYWEEVEALDFTQLAERTEPRLLRVDLWSPYWEGVLLEYHKTTSAIRMLAIKGLALEFLSQVEHDFRRLITLELCMTKLALAQESVQKHVLGVNSIEYVNDRFSQIMSRWDRKFKNGNITYMLLVSSIMEANRRWNK
jgi:hypothetical protein